MRVSTLLYAASSALLVDAIPAPPAPPAPPSPPAVPAPPAPPLGAPPINPFLGKEYYVPSHYAKSLDKTVAAFLAKNDTLNAARTRTVQNTSTFTWVTSISGLSNIDTAVTEAVAAYKKTKKPQIVTLVLYNLPDRDCSGGESGGELSSANDGLNKYKTQFIDGFAKKVGSQKQGISFAIVLEPDSLGNTVTNTNVPFCANAAPIYEDGIAYAISKLQFPHVALYIDAAHGGWLGWDDNLPLAAAEFSKVVKLAGSKYKKGSKIRGFSTDVSNFNPYVANPRANYTEYSNSYDEFNYAKSLAPFLTNASLPANFIIDQGRSGLQNQRETWGEWCNVKAGYGVRPTTKTNSTLVDSIVWIKPAGESDGACGPDVFGTKAPNAGQWWDEYAQQSVINADPALPPTY